jgi:hypothetical protein
MKKTILPILVTVLWVFCSCPLSSVAQSPSQLAPQAAEAPPCKVGDKWTWGTRTSHVVEVKDTTFVTREKTEGTNSLCMSNPPIMEMLAERDKNCTMVKVTDLSGRTIPACSY